MEVILLMIAALCLAYGIPELWEGYPKRGLTLVAIAAIALIGIPLILSQSIQERTLEVSRPTKIIDLDRTKVIFPHKIRYKKVMRSQFLGVFKARIEYRVIEEKE